MMKSGDGGHKSARVYTPGMTKSKSTPGRQKRTADWEYGLEVMFFGWVVAGIGGVLSGQRLCKGAAPCTVLRPISRPGSGLKETGAEMRSGNGDRQHEEEEERRINVRNAEKIRGMLLNDPQEWIRVFEYLTIEFADSAPADNLEVGKGSNDASVGQPEATREGGKCEVDGKPILDFRELNGDWDWECTWDTKQTWDSNATGKLKDQGGTEEMKGSGKTKGRLGEGSGLVYRHGSMDGHKGAAIATGGANPAEREREKERGKSSTVSMEGSGISAGKWVQQKMATREGRKCEVDGKPILDFRELNGDWDWECTWDTKQTWDSNATGKLKDQGGTEEMKGSGKTKGRLGEGSGLVYRHGSMDGHKGAAIATGGANPAEREREKEKSSTVSMEGSGIGASKWDQQKMPRDGRSLATERAHQGHGDTEENNQLETAKGLAKHWREAEQANKKSRMWTSMGTERALQLTGVGERQTQETTAVPYKKRIATAMIIWVLMRWETKQESNRKAGQSETATGLAKQWKGTEKKKAKNWKQMLKDWIKHGGEGSRMTAD